MSYFYSKPFGGPVDPSQPGQAFLGEASLAQIAEAARQSALYVDNVVAGQALMERTYQDTIDDVQRLTGQQLVNPYLGDMPDQEELQALNTARAGGRRTDIIQIRRDRFGARLQELAGAHPGKAEELLRLADVDGRARKLARDTDDRLARFMNSRPGLAKWGATIAGGLIGAAADPFQLATAFIGFGPGAAKTIAGRLATTAAREFAVNAGVEAAMQPFVQAHRERMGLEHGIDQALANIAMSGAFGASFGLGGQAIVEAFRGGRIRLSPEQRAAVERELAANSAVDANLRAALQGDAQAAARVLDPVKSELPPSVRGALDAIADEPPPPREVAAETHADATREAIRASAATEAPRFTPDEKQLVRLVDAIAPDINDAPDPNAPSSLLEFIAAAGGMQDFKGELKALDAHKARVKVGRRQLPIVTKDGSPIDRMREAAQEAGYFAERVEANRQNTVTVGDLLDLVDRELRGEKIYPQGYVPPPRYDAERVRASADEMFRDLVNVAGPGLPDQVYLRAVELMQSEGLDIADAAERAILEMPEPDAVGARTGEPLPGWSDDELIALSTERGDPEPLLDTPPPAAAAAAELADDAELESLAAELGDLEVPSLDPDGPPLRAADMIADAKRELELAEIIDACPF